MIVKLKSWEDAKKAEAANDDNYSNDYMCFGIGHNYLPWGEFVEIIHSWYDEAAHDTTYEYDDFFIPSWLVDFVIDNNNVLKYGNILIDRSFTLYNGGYVRIRIIEICGRYYYHNMTNGKLVECSELRNGNTES